MARTTFAQWVKSYVTHRRIKKVPRRTRRVSQFEALTPRITPAINAFFTGGQLTILGDAADNTIVVSRDAAGVIKINDGAVAIRGGTPTVANTARLQIFGLGGNDNLSLDETNGALPAANLFGGAGNDILTGGSRSDLLFGQAGNDLIFGRGGADFLFGGADNDSLTGGAANDFVFGENGNDRMIWNPGDETDLNEGGTGADTVEVNGGNGGENFVASANGARVRFERLIFAPFSIDVGTSEFLVLNANGGDDRFTATGDLAPRIALTVDGGAGNDGLFGSNGADTLLGGEGDDFVDGNGGADRVLLGAGDDSFQWDPGDGSDIVEGQSGFDSMQFNGTDGNEEFELSAAAGRMRLSRNVGNVALDTNGLEKVTLSVFGGADQVTIRELNSTSVAEVAVELAASGGFGGDVQNDTVTVFGTNANDGVSIVEAAGGQNGYTVAGLSTAITVRDSEASDSLVLNAMNGNDVVSAATLPAQRVLLTIVGGVGNDTLIGSQGDDSFRWDVGDGDDSIDGGRGDDRMIFNGSDLPEIIRLTAVGNRLGLLRNEGAAGTERLNLNLVEQVDVNVFGGADTIFVNDVSATHLDTLNLNLKTTSVAGDAQADAIVVDGNAGDDAFQIASFDNGSRVAVATTFFPFINITGAEAANDRLVVNTLGGDDIVDAGSLAANAIGLTLNGGDGNDTLLAGGGNDLVTGGAGIDSIFLESGADTFVWNPGDGSDFVHGGGGADRMIFNGTNDAESITFSAVADHVRFLRNLGQIAIDLDAVEQVDFNAFGGADLVIVNDLTGTDLVGINLDLEGAVGGFGDGKVDLIVVHGTAGDDLIPVLGNNGGILVNGDFLGGGGLAAFILIRGVEATDALRIHGGAGGDVIDADDLETPVRLIVDGGEGDDTLIGSARDDVLLGSEGDDTLFGGPGEDILDGGPGENTIIQD